MNTCTLQGTKLSKHGSEFSLNLTFSKAYGVHRKKQNEKMNPSLNSI